MTIDAAIGPVNALHRLAMGVECFDALLEQLVLSPVRVGWQAPSRRLRQPTNRAWPCLDLEASGPARFKLRHVQPLPDPLVIRVDDLARRYVPRRFAVHPWPPGMLDKTAAAPYVPVSSRLLRNWLWPGSAYPVPRGTTVVRGRVEYPDHRPARWARLTAIGPTNRTAGLAHADERGEFVLMITDAAQNPLRSTVPIDLTVRAAAPSAALDPFDRCADLVIEEIPRSAVPPIPANLANDVLRGVATPPGYRDNKNPAAALTAVVGAELLLTDAIVFDPKP